MLVACQKEINGFSDGIINPADIKPRVGTIWTYRYTTYQIVGSVIGSKVIYHKAKSEETLGGEKWLKIVDVDADTTVYFLNIKSGGLYQYTNSSSYLFCKYPAVLNDNYNTLNDGTTEDFTVKGVNDTLPTGIGDIPANYYEGIKDGYLIDRIWYNKNAWIVHRVIWQKKPFPSVAYYRYSTMYIDNIVY
jgi:hypothetical protein